jgi:dipeptidyl aminopeptidase/acylaminoacyl peptidase
VSDAPGGRVLPYGEWPSPISAADVARGERSVGGGCWVGDEVWWSELRPDEGGRTAVCRRDAGGAVVDVLPAPWNARTRVHEYGGGAWTAGLVGSGPDAAGETPVLVFAEFGDQRLHLLRPGAEPTPLTAAPRQPAGERYGDLQLTSDGRSVLCVRERHDGSAITRDIVVVPLDGSAVDDPAAIRTLAGGADFLAMPALSPDGSRLAYVAWNHPQMPWDGTQLRVADLTGGSAPVTLMGGTDESVLGPVWLPDGRIAASSDRSGWWSLYLIEPAGGEPEPLAPMAADVGGPLWTLNLRWHTVLHDGRILACRTLGVDELIVVDPGTGAVEPVELPGVAGLSIGPQHGHCVLLSLSGARLVAGLRRLDLATGELTDIRLAHDEPPPAEWLPDAELRTFPGPGGREVHAVVYPPRAPGVHAPDGERPPYIVRVHGGPTSSVKPHLTSDFAFWTSRGIGVVDVNYGGSTGYGRDYRERLREQWGIVDVEDVVAVATGLADAALADGDRLAILGGSAGGWTVLAALTRTDTFGCGVSYYGVAELVEFAQTTHDFESRYLDGLIGPLPETLDRYVDRAPISHVDELSVPVLLLQGLDDPVVPPAQAEMFREAMARKGIRHAYLAFEGESHGFRRAETNIRCLEASLSFIGQVFGFSPPGVATLELTTG